MISIVDQTQDSKVVNSDSNKASWGEKKILPKQGSPVFSFRIPLLPS